MLYLEIYAEHGVGWRMPIPDSYISKPKKGKVTISGLSFPIDESCILMTQYSIVSDDSGPMETLWTGELILANRMLTNGDTVYIDGISLELS